ncbi:HD domain-containing phosphohydrolase [Paenibacillus yanchengensis]|uniref:HD domain-containing phosphohydrolase n=1 Tax=Paenibacillus yanchengensis TaxID=2035833 RepID=A0ABW4YG97_9BACL
MEQWNKSKVLIIDDQECQNKLLEKILQQLGFKHIYFTIDPIKTKHLITATQPDIILIGFHMLHKDGIDLLNEVNEYTEKEPYLPVLCLVDSITPSTKQTLLETGMHDFIYRPYDSIEVKLRMSSLLQVRRLQVMLQQNSNHVEERVQQRTEELQLAKIEILSLLGRAAEFRDDRTGEHTQRVGWLSGKIAERLGLKESIVEMIAVAAPLHDIGKIGIPDAILLKPGSFNKEEFEIMKTHTTIGYRILEGTSFSILHMAGIIAKYHHEKWDGTGYPYGLKGEEIPLPARIVALADFYDALTHERPYKRAWTPEETIEEVLQQKGKHFDPQVVEAFHKLFYEEDLSKMLTNNIHVG